MEVNYKQIKKNAKNKFENYTKKDLKFYTKNIINKIGLCNSIKNCYPLCYDLFLYLITRHPNYPNKFGNVIDFKIKYNPKFKKQLDIIFVKENGDEDNVSIIKKCIMGKKKNNLNIAMRNSICSQISDFRRKNIRKCVKCKSKKNLEVDHKYPQFNILCKNFLKTQKYIPKNFIDNEFHSKIFKKEDINFENNWYNYHKSNCNLQYLCKKCHNLKSKKVYNKKCSYSKNNNIFSKGICLIDIDSD